MTTKINVEFVIYGDKFYPDEITKILGLKPKKQWIKGQKMKNNKALRTDTCWFYELGYVDSLDMDNQLLKLINIFSPCIDDLMEIKKRLNVHYCILVAVIIENDNTPAMSFTSPVIKFLCEIGGELDIDLYTN